MNRNRVSRRPVLEMLGGTALAAALPARTLYAQGAKAPLTLGIQTSVWGAVGMVAEAEKMFQKAGANVTVLKFDSADHRDAMIAGKVDIGSLGTAPFIVGVAKGELGSLATVAYAGRTNSIVAAKGAGIKTVADLKGRKVGSQIGSSTHHIFTNRIAPKFGLKPDDYQIINTKFENHNAASLASRWMPMRVSSHTRRLRWGPGRADHGLARLTSCGLACGQQARTDAKRDAVVAFARAGWRR
jgi:ABC-type nitrate/sulfonate/bicarbonate transport system substrate-binding protein